MEGPELLDYDYITKRCNIAMCKYPACLNGKGSNYIEILQPEKLKLDRDLFSLFRFMFYFPETGITRILF